MNLKDDDKIDILKTVCQDQRNESLQHRQSIFNAFSLSVAALLVIMAGIISANVLPKCAKIILMITDVFIWIAVGVFIRQQRKESSKALKIVDEISEELKLFETGVYLKDKPVYLKNDFKENIKHNLLGFSGGDIRLMTILGGLCLLIFMALIYV